MLTENKKTENYSCRICSSNLRVNEHVAKEMMFGTQQEFTYDECGSCGSVQIRSIPTQTEMRKHYSSGYYSHSGLSDNRNLRRDLKLWLLSLEVKIRLGFPLTWPILRRILKTPGQRQAFLGMLAAVNLSKKARILDVGCGTDATFLHILHGFGVTELFGCDPYIGLREIGNDKFTIYPSPIEEVSGQYDLITFNHSLEHLANPLAALQKARSLLKPCGFCIVRIPTPSSELWKVYGTEWNEFDAPRHFHLISRTGMEISASEAGFLLEKVIDDEPALAEVSSQFCKEGVPLSKQPRQSRHVIKTAEKKASIRNHKGDGCRAGFILSAALK